MIRIAAQTFSILFHPLFMLLYMVLVLLWSNPFSFGYRHIVEADTLLIILVMTTIVLPALAIFMMKMLGWVQSFELPTRQERIAPYLVCGILYLSLYLHVSKASGFPPSIRVAVLGTLLGLWLCFFINNFIKVSVHASGVGGLVAMVGLTGIMYGSEAAQIGLFLGENLVLPLKLILYISIIIAGVTCTSRIILQAHSPKEVYIGFCVGIVSILVAYLFTGQS